MRSFKTDSASTVHLWKSSFALCFAWSLERFSCSDISVAKRLLKTSAFRSPSSFRPHAASRAAATSLTAAILARAATTSSCATSVCRLLCARPAPQATKLVASAGRAAA
eukprot:CAMPEP_0115180888 /NCGR_PEP_ID=MMETSP0270-20121206/7151_1 /TAXON_ID=71861 /ORGANISM="Scrippsiella trochoidea, Strain CCMP3099" /LENGTH=108 /DNA_ID=CAMNT_0002593901 /DNA_START=29 /DNA_END=352 /DNA_ORIENTATION=-